LHGFARSKVVVLSDAIVLPVCASAFDRDFTADCWAELRAQPRVKSGRCRVAWVGVRLDGRTDAEHSMRDWAASLGLEWLGSLRSAQVCMCARPVIFQHGFPSCGAACARHGRPRVPASPLCRFDPVLWEGCATANIGTGVCTPLRGPRYARYEQTTALCPLAVVPAAHAGRPAAVAACPVAQAKKGSRSLGGRRISVQTAEKSVSFGDTSVVNSYGY
jgi:hypothetical protein